MTGYREAAVVERYEEPVTRVTFRARHRSVGWLSAAVVGAGVGIWFSTLALRAANTPLVVAGMLVPMVCFGAAFYAMSVGAGAVEMTVTRRARDAFDVVLRRQWGFLPWTAPLSFSAAKAPSLVTRWVTGRSSGKHGPSVPYRHASLFVMSGEAVIALPTMRATSKRVGKEHVAELAASVEAAMQRYHEELAALPRVAASSGTREEEDASASLIGSSESAVSLAAGVATLAVLLVATALGGAAYALPVSRLATACCALVVPVLFGGIAIVSAAVFQGRTFHLKRKLLGDVQLIAVADYAYFGPRGTSAKMLSRGFTYRIAERTVGEEERTVYALVDAKTGDTLHEDSEESVVRRYGRALGGVETKRAD